MKKQMQKQWFYVALAVLVLLLAGSCLSPYDGGEDSGLPEEDGTIAAVSELFTTTDESGNPRLTRFYTNDSKYRTPWGYTLWTAGDGTATTPFTARTLSVRKPSGDARAGYGIVICEAIRDGEGISERVFLTVMINNNREYAIGKVRGASYESLVWWTASENLVGGGGMSNQIKVELVLGTTDTYKLYLNDMVEEVLTFVDSGLPPCAAVGRNGYIVVIAPADLNNSGVEVWFNETL
jgi:hypothetical protein